jgi:hypothetical protein
MKCAHDGCKCPEAKIAKNGGHYCSDYCAKNGRKPGAGGRCGCGHATCH